MTLFVVFGVMTAVVLALLVPPLLRRPGERLPRAAYDLEIYRDQLREIERDVERGLIDSSQAASARTEVERRMLAADPEADTAANADASSPAAPHNPVLAVAFALVIALPLGAGSLYLWLGSPGLEGQSFAARERPASPPGAAGNGSMAGMDLETAATRLAERLAAQPDDIEGWMMLGRTYGVLNRYDEAVVALRHAAALSDDDPSVMAMLGEHQVFAAQGLVSPDAIDSFESALAADPRQPVAHFYLGLADAQAGDKRGALDRWVALAKDSPADAPWLPDVRARIEELADALGVDVATLLPEAPPATPGPTRDDIEAAGEMSVEDRMVMIRTMIARLAARLEEEPGDLEGWVRLGRSYRVLGEMESARDALARAAALAPDDASVAEDYATALVATAPDGEPLTREAVAALRHLADLDADNPSALWLLGRAAAESGDAAEARALWRRLLALLPPDSPARAAVSQAIDTL